MVQKGEQKMKADKMIAVNEVTFRKINSLREKINEKNWNSGIGFSYTNGQIVSLALMALEEKEFPPVKEKVREMEM